MQKSAMRRRGWPICTAIAFSALALGACSSAATTGSTSGSESVGTNSSSYRGGTAHLAASQRPSYLVYWDQNEEEDFVTSTGIQGVLLPPWDINGQLCVLPDDSGRFVGGYDPTVPSQHNPGGVFPYKQPPIGEELDLPDGAFSGQTLYVPGPFKLPGETIGGDSPPTASGNFNSNSTYTGCVFDRHGDLLASDIGTAQGQFPPPDDGRLVEWFGPNYSQSCIVMGPTQGGAGPHHVDGTGGLSQPGMLTLADNGDVLLPVAGTQQVLRLEASSLPTSPSQCPGGEYPANDLHTSVFFQGNGTTMPFPAGVAKDPTCDCIAISSFFGNPSIIWVDQQGTPVPGRTGVPGETIAQLGQDPNGFNPFGMAFAPDGTLYFVDIHITCKDNMLTNCGPANYGGRVMKVTFDNGVPSTPTVVASGFDFPTSVTLCIPAQEDCPYPVGHFSLPHSGPSENPSPAIGPPSDRPATAGFG
ncbi:MAG TPA: hypothetical protein VEJ87_04640 [Acidimicrobiales bacterium]|nr:hypothetical protein [Acidimicrobiales bacterium]